MKMWNRAVLFLAALTCGGSAMAADAENAVYMDLAFGRVTIQLLPSLAPSTVARFKTLVRQGFYDGVVFHRVIDGFMAQTGDPTGTGTGGSGHPLRAEFSKEKFVRGTVAMARTDDPNSADSQFFIMYADAPGLDGKYTIFGHVQSGMEYVDKLKKGDPNHNGAVNNPDKIIKIQVIADVITAQEKANLPKEEQEPQKKK
jgi:peptidylprolyl isomerase